MTKGPSISERNVEEIRRKNLQDNQIFLEKLLLNNIRNDFLDSARSILRKTEKPKTPIQLPKIEYSTRYQVKVKSGEILPHIPQWQREREAKLLEQEQKKMKKIRRRRRRRPSKWTLFSRKNPRPYERVFQPRQTKISERIEEELNEHAEWSTD